MTMRGSRASGSEGSRAAVSNTVAAAAVVIVVFLAIASGYLLFLRPASTVSGNSTTQAGPGSSPSSAVSAFALYNDYNLGQTATDYPQFTAHTIYARGNITGIVRDPNSPVVETQLATPGSSFEYWFFQNDTGIPAIAQNQPVLAQCYVQGLVMQKNGTQYLYLNNCSVVPPTR
jgi:hypothetical protein